MKKVIIVDWLDMYGGAERVIKSLCHVFKYDRCYALVDLMSKENKEKIFSGSPIPVKQSFLKYFGSKFRYFFPLFYPALKKMKIEKDVNLIISSSHAIAKGIRKSSDDQLYISYFQARNQKYLWEDYDLYFGEAKFFINPFKSYLRAMDVKAAQQPDYIISNSKFVQEWVKKTYKRDSDIIYPPVDLSQFHLQTQKEDYFVAVGRIEPYKRFDIVIDAFNKTDKTLVIIGDGSQFEDLKAKANENITFTGFLNSDKVFEYISKAKAFIHAGIEDFGIAPVEAQACGTPVIAFGQGGVLETVIENETGLFFREPTAKSLLRCLNKFDEIIFDPYEIRRNAENYDIPTFENRIAAFVQDKIQEFQIRQQ